MAAIDLLDIEPETIKGNEYRCAASEEERDARLARGLIRRIAEGSADRHSSELSKP